VRRKLLLGCFLFALARVAAAQSAHDVCRLPEGLQAVIHGKYPGTRVVTIPDLSEDDKKLFQKGHADSCPGLVNVDFYGDGKPTLALALTTGGTNDNPVTKLVLARKMDEQWQVTFLDKADGPIPVVWSEKPGTYKDMYGRRTILASAPVVVFCGYSSWALVYAWIDGKIAKVWLRD
jgi:hypothetical protein